MTLDRLLHAQTAYAPACTGPLWWSWWDALWEYLGNHAAMELTWWHAMGESLQCPPILHAVLPTPAQRATARVALRLIGFDSEVWALPVTESRRHTKR